MPKCLSVTPPCAEDVPAGGFCPKHQPVIQSSTTFEQPSRGGGSGDRHTDSIPMSTPHDAPTPSPPRGGNEPRTHDVRPGRNFPGDKGGRSRGGDKGGGGGFRGGGGGRF